LVNKGKKLKEQQNFWTFLPYKCKICQEFHPAYQSKCDNNNDDDDNNDNDNDDDDNNKGFLLVETVLNHLKQNWLFQLRMPLIE